MRKTNKRSTIITFSTIMIIIVMVVIVLLAIQTPLIYAEFYIFAEISECEHLLERQASDDYVKQDLQTANDPHIKKLKYKDFWGMKYRSSSLAYEFYAYEFENADAALTYYVDVTGQTGYLEDIPLSETAENKYWVESHTFFKYKMIVMLGNKVYRLTAPSKDAKEILDILSDAFSIPISQPNT